MKRDKPRAPFITRYVYAQDKANFKIVAFRLALIIGIILLIAFSIYMWNFFADKPHYRFSEDKGKPVNETTELTYKDCVYFTVISITTTGYGDIIPVEEDARIFDTVIITIGRAAVWFILISTAYQFVYQRFRDVVKMKAIQKKLDKHVVICGYETTGRTAAQELLAQGMNKGNMVIVTNDEIDSQEAADAGFISILGDATKENVLKKAQIEKATCVIIATNHDATNVLIALTSNDLNPNIRIVSQSNEAENIKLLRKSGAHTTISPLVSGGSLMAIATKHRHASDMLADIMTAKQGVTFKEKEVTSTEIGKNPKALKGVVVFGVVRGGETLDIEKLDSLKLKKGDLILYMSKIK